MPETGVARIAIAFMLLLLTGPSTLAQGDDLNCAAFDSQVWAQSVFDEDPEANAALDLDGDGIACPELAPGAAPALWTDEIPADAEPAVLSRVIDGDTIEVILADGTVETVRLILVDTSETKKPNSPIECFGPEATAFTAWLLSLGGELSLEKDVSERDRFDRLLRYAWLDFGDGEVYNVSEAIVRSGYGALATFPPDVKYVDEIRAAQTFAREHEYGLWATCEGPHDPLPTAVPTPEPQPVPTPTQPSPGCDPSYPTLCIPPFSPDIDCGEIGARRFPVLPPDPHGFDGEGDGIGCERD